MTTIPYSPTEIKALRDEVRLYGINISNEQSWKVLRHVGDRRLAVDALLMKARPKWLEELAGPR
jgi:hypothetical protein